MNKTIEQLLRPNIRQLTAYASARSEFNGTALAWLDANENSFGSGLEETCNRYPDPLQNALKKRISDIRDITEDKIFLGNGSDEAIDLLIRSFCEPGRDNVLLFPPTYGMYEVSARINDVAVREVKLTTDFRIDPARALEAVDAHTKLLFVCSPNNPTGNRIDRDTIITLLEDFPGLVILDEAYADFAPGSSLLYLCEKYERLVVLQTLSKAWGLAGLRLGMAFADPRLIAVLNKVKPPYNISTASQQLALKALGSDEFLQESIRNILSERRRLERELVSFPFVKKLFPSNTNFILVQVTDAGKLYAFLADRGIIVRNRSSMPLCDNCLRITTGTPQENDLLLTQLKDYENA